VQITDLMLIGCYLCKEPFEHGDSVCTISSRVYDDASLGFSTVFATQDIKEGLSILKEVNFHTSCFVKVAGDDYVP